MILRIFRDVIETFRIKKWERQLPFKVEPENKERLKYSDKNIIAYIYYERHWDENDSLMLDIDLGFVSAYAQNDLVNKISLTAEQRKLIKERLILVHEKWGIPVYFEDDELENENNATNGQVTPPLPD